MTARAALASAVSTKERLDSVNLGHLVCLARSSARRMPAWQNILGPRALGMPPTLWISRLAISGGTSEKSGGSPQLQQIRTSSLLQVSHGLVHQTRSGLLSEKVPGDHLSSLIPNRPRGLLTTTTSRRRVKMPCFSQLESSRLTVNSVVAVICANSSRERLISSAPSTLRP